MEMNSENILSYVKELEDKIKVLENGPKRGIYSLNDIIYGPVSYQGSNGTICGFQFGVVTGTKDGNIEKVDFPNVKGNFGYCLDEFSKWRMSDIKSNDLVLDFRFVDGVRANTFEKLPDNDELNEENCLPYVGQNLLTFTKVN
jgi:hypothetical protein